MKILRIAVLLAVLVFSCSAAHSARHLRSGRSADGWMKYYQPRYAPVYQPKYEVYSYQAPVYNYGGYAYQQQYIQVYRNPWYRSGY